MRKQASTRPISTAAIMRHAEFRKGFEDARAGRAPRFDDFADDWFYERGRQFAFIAPLSMSLVIGNKLNRRALFLLDAALDRKLVI